ncbi:uncharacterized protein IL334_003158 [Kwoniella shivajii]|uniref:Transcriptional coactivator p15 (PC4) C-terminal domain-containing protein n=1 Tax=Kwoniella shivajii TaxID=564305 RepID=A0ABZ1CWR8_9TREE|nr:hypothetical protein IL334_003158 [Kwoniella shivajii]
MPPRRALSSSDDDSDVKPSVSKASTSKPNKSDDEPKSKKVKKNTSNEEGAVEVEQNEQGDQYIKLSEVRRLTVRTFKGKVLVDMREMYKDKGTGQMKPGSKGISLTKEQWDLIKNNINNVDDMIAKVNEK